MAGALLLRRASHFERSRPGLDSRISGRERNTGITERPELLAGAELGPDRNAGVARVKRLPSRNVRHARSSGQTQPTRSDNFADWPVGVSGDNLIQDVDRRTPVRPPLLPHPGLRNRAGGRGGVGVLAQARAA